VKIFFDSQIRKVLFLKEKTFLKILSLNKKFLILAHFARYLSVQLFEMFLFDNDLQRFECICLCDDKSPKVNAKRDVFRRIFHQVIKQGCTSNLTQV
jgi:hypothetical protein